MECPQCRESTNINDSKASGTNYMYKRAQNLLDIGYSIADMWTRSFRMRVRVCKKCDWSFPTIEVACEDYESNPDRLRDGNRDKWFASVMQSRIDKDIKEAKWEDKTEKQMLNRAKDKFLQLAETVHRFGSKDSIIGDCATVANYALMIAKISNNLITRNRGEK